MRVFPSINLTWVFDFASFLLFCLFIYLSLVCHSKAIEIEQIWEKLQGGLRGCWG